MPGIPTHKSSSTVSKYHVPMIPTSVAVQPHPTITAFIKCGDLPTYDGRARVLSRKVPLISSQHKKFHRKISPYKNLCHSKSMCGHMKYATSNLRYCSENGFVSCLPKNFLCQFGFICGSRSDPMRSTSLHFLSLVHMCKQTHTLVTQMQSKTRRRTWFAEGEGGL